MKSKVEVVLAVECPELPNFLKIAGVENATVDVARLTDLQLRQLGRIWAQALLIHAQKRRRELREGKTAPAGRDSKV